MVGQTANNEPKPKMKTPNHKFTIFWNRPYQGIRESTTASTECETAHGAYRALVTAQTEPGCTHTKVVNYRGARVTARQLRAWARIK